MEKIVQATTVIAPDGTLIGADEQFFRHFHHLSFKNNVADDFLHQAKGGQAVSYATVVCHTKDGKEINVYAKMTVLRDQNEQLKAIVVAYQYEPFVEMNWLSTFTAHTSEFTIVLSPEGEFVYVSPSARRMLGKDEPVERELFSYIHADDLSTVMEALHTLREAMNSQTVECRWSTKDGQFIWMHMHIEPLLNDDHELENVIIVAKDITKWKCCEQSLEQLRYFDTLTGVANRFHFEEYVSHLIQKQQPFALCCVDFHKIKWINDRFSYEAGDRFLKEAVHRMQRHLREGDFVARIGGDEFAIIMLNDQKEEVAKRMEELSAIFFEPFQYGQHAIQSSFSAGVTFFPRDGIDLQTLFKQVDQALCYAKENGKGYHFYHPKQNRRTMIEQELPLALLNNQFYLCYQPKVSLGSRQIMGVEALIRWTHPLLGPISPLEFIPIAEKSGFIFEITRWVLKEACCQVKQWHNHFSKLKLAVNLSPFLLNRKEFATYVTHILEETNFPPHDLILEVTESGLMENIETGKHILTELQQLGVQVAIDDFGTGFSSLAYIRNLPISLLKIDRSFIKDITDNSKDATIVDTIIHLAKSLNLQVLAEGVERSDQVSLLQKMECDFAQGFYFSQSLEAEKLFQWLEQHNQLKEALH